MALLSFALAATLWYRTILSENPDVGLVPSEISSDGKILILHLRIRNPGKHALILHHLRFKSPPRAEVGVTLRDQNDVRVEVARGYKQQSVGEDVEVLDYVVDAGEETVVQITMTDISRRLNLRLKWSKQSPVVFPWPPTCIKRSPRILKEMAEAAPAIL